MEIVLISKVQHWGSPAEKLAEEKTARLQRWQEKPRGTEKQENVFLFEFGLIVPAVPNVYFGIICADVVYQESKLVIPIFSLLL